MRVNPVDLLWLWLLAMKPMTSADASYVSPSILANGLIKEAR
jgi:hypothetical protein